MDEITQTWMVSSWKRLILIVFFLMKLCLGHGISSPQSKESFGLETFLFFFQLRISSKWKLFQDCALILIFVADHEDGDLVKHPSGTSLSGASDQFEEAFYLEMEGGEWEGGWWRQH